MPQPKGERVEVAPNSHLLPATGLRFFTVYGPWGRPDITMYIFAKAMSEGLRIRLFNYGRMRRDFASVDVVVEARERHRQAAGAGRFRARQWPRSGEKCRAVAPSTTSETIARSKFPIGRTTGTRVWSQSRNGARADAA
jgi:hypothetical protein